MPRHSIPKVIDDYLLASERAGQNLPAIQVGSEAWYTWLKQPTTRSFAFHSQEGTLTARREQRQDTWYWYGYRSQDGHLHKVYLGKSEDLTSARLQAAVVSLSTEHVTPEPSDTLTPPQPQAATLPPAHPPASVASISSLPLLATKLYVPPARLNLVARPRLTERMNAAMKSKLTLVVAPAGWGKTTLLSSWYAEISQSTRSLAWVSLDEGDNDPMRFWMYVITALNRLHPGVGENPLALLQATPSAPIGVVLTSLLNALIPISTETMLVLDDYHLIETQPIHDALIYLVEHLPPNLHLVLASRLDPPLPLARLRVRGALIELRAANLRFTNEETTTFFTEAMGLKLSAEQVAALLARTEGWIAGLHMAALSLQDRHDVADFIAAFTGSHRYVADYLIEEVLLRQPEDVQDFLVQTCLLDRLSGLLCDAVRERDDSQALLEQVERSNLFLIPLDDERRWYRYHHLFAEVLRTRLRQTQPTLVPELHHRASCWYEQHKLFEEAVTHALAVPDPERAVNLIEQYARFTSFPSRFQILLGWLNRLPDALVRSHPSLCIMHAIMLMLTHQLDAAQARIQDAEACLAQEMPPEQRRVILSLIAAFRGNLTRLFGDSERCVPLAQQALELMPEPEPEELSIIRMFRPSTLVTAANTYLVDGDTTTATERFVASTVTSVRALGNVPTTMRSISNLARLHLLQGKLHQAALTIEQAQQLASRHGGLQDLLNGADYYFILGDLLREWNQLDKAEQHLAQGIEMVKSALTADAEMIMRGYLALARLQQARGWSTQALKTLDTFMQVAYQSGFAPLLMAYTTAVRAQVELAQGNVPAALQWVTRSGISPNDDSLSFLHEREYLTLARVYIVQGRLDSRTPFLHQALDLLNRLLQDAESKSRMSSTLEILMLQALALDAQDRRTEAMAKLRRALALAEPEGYIRLFLDEGAPMVALLHQASTHGVASGYVFTLLEAAGECVAVEHRLSSLHTDPLVEPLTEREHEVLQLLADGASNREIADHLVLSVNTVKKHVLNICGKLGVQSRTQAIAKARSLNLYKSG